MAIRQKLNDDIKTAMLSGDKLKVETLRGLKTVMLYADVAAGKRDTGGIADDVIVGLFAREVKKRQESADLYVRGGSQERADKELAEKAIIETYLPTQLGEAELTQIVQDVIAEQKAEGSQAMGKVIGVVKSKVGNSADGSAIARIVKEQLQI
jgi:uncharacterized protein YqeY